jgi:hypothetical protein
MKSISEEKYNSLSKIEQKEYVKEWACSCNECDKKWHFLDSTKKQLESIALSNNLIGTSACCGNPIGLYGANKGREFTNELNKLKQCPDCKSTNIELKAKYHKK